MLIERLEDGTLEVDAGFWVVPCEPFELWPGGGVDLDVAGGMISGWLVELMALIG